VSTAADGVRRDAARTSAPAPVLRVSGLGKQFSAHGAVALTGVTFDVADGELLAVVGPSGCGKTTLLRLLTGLTPPTEGEVLLDGKPVLRPPAEVAIVFQDYSRSLFPWLNVLRNVLLPLRRTKLSKQRKIERAESVLREMGLIGVSDRYPWQLSGGMQQRVAIARALVSRPELLLLDEPFASVDALTRADLQDVVLRVHHEHQPMTIVHVTHDIDEAVYLADRVLVLSPSPGRVVGAIDVALPRPRTQTETRSAPRFLAVRNEIHEVISAHPRSTAATLESEDR
jgi:NitT/TauT family transport system ATP-binding protein